MALRRRAVRVDSGTTTGRVGFVGRWDPWGRRHELGTFASLNYLLAFVPRWLSAFVPLWLSAFVPWSLLAFVPCFLQVLEPPRAGEMLSKF